MTGLPPMNERLQRLHAAARERGRAPHESPKEANITHAFFELHADLPLPERQARSLVHGLLNEPIVYDDNETIAGQVFQACPGAGDPFLNGGDSRWDDFSVAGMGPKMVAERLPDHALYGRHFSDGAAPGHIGWDWRMVLELGLEGLRELHAQALDKARDERNREYHQCTLIALDGALAFADQLAAGASAELRSHCEHVPRRPSESFREAVQAFWTQYIAVMFENPYGGNGPGLVDRFLWPYLERDLEAGAITLDEARDVVRELLIKLDERIHPADGWVEAICVGGRGADGKGAENPLSYMIIETIMELNQTHPSIYVRLRDDAPEDFRRLAIEYLLRSGNRGQIYGDDRVIEALVAAGHTPEDAREWMAGGCMEVSSQARNCDFNFTFVHNFAWTLEALLYGGTLPHSRQRVAPLERDLAAYGSFDDLFAAFETELRRELKLVFDRLNIYFEAYARYRPQFLISSLIHDCLERGRTMNDGGARYADFSGSGLAIPNVADSLIALKHAVYDEGFCTAEEMLAALRADFEGYEALRARLLALPKFGQDNAEADAMANRVLRIYTDAANSHVTPHGGRVRPLVLGFVWVVQIGQLTGALPDGRKAGQPLAHGLAPQGGSATFGLTAAINSATSLDLQEVGGGASMMWDLDSAWATPQTVEPILQTFIAQGGHIFQGNMTDVERLLAACERPEQHRDVMVRVGGYSARFVTLSPEMQEEIIQRHRYSG
jgi:pyruvate-formate lyase